jgi:hypothetical protein
MVVNPTRTKNFLYKKKYPAALPRGFFITDKRGVYHRGHKIGANECVFCLTHPVKHGAQYRNAPA